MVQEEVKKMIEVKKELYGKPLNIAAEKVKLMLLRDACRDVKDTDQLEKVCRQIEELEQMVKDGKTTVSKTELINMRNVQSNQRRTVLDHYSIGFTV